MRNHIDAAYKGRTAIINAGFIVSGDFHRGILDGDCILVEDGFIRDIGSKEIVNDVDHIVDVQGQVLCPGFIDTHVHNSFDDFHPITRTVDWMESYLWYGITTLVSEGEESPGLPRFYQDPIGVKATSILAKRIYDNFRPGGFQKVHGGPVVLVPGLSEKDFAEMAEAGVWRIAQIGGGGLNKVGEVLPLVKIAREYNFWVSVSIGPASIPGSADGGLEMAIQVKPDKLAHINGGSSAPSWKELQELINETDCYLELVTVGNQNINLKIFELLKDQHGLHRVVFGSDTPTGQGALPNCIQRMIMFASAFSDIAPEQAIAMGTGNSADMLKLNTGKLEAGRAADILAIDTSLNAVGKNALEAIKRDDTFGVSMVMVDGQICSVKGRDGRPTAKSILIDGKPVQACDIDEYLFGPKSRSFLT